MMTIKPHRDHVLILPDAKGGTTPGGIVIPEHWGPPPGSGTVIKVGPGRWNGADWCQQCGRRHPLQWTAMDVKPGDKVAYRWLDVGESRRWEHEGKTFIFLRRHEITGIIEQIEEPKAA